MKKLEQDLRRTLERQGYDVDALFSSDVLSEKEKNDALASMLADIIKNQSNNSTKVQKRGALSTEDFHLGFISDTHSRVYLLEKYLRMLDDIGGKCVVTGDVSNGSNHFHGHDNSLNETQNLSQDILSMADIMNRYKDMFIGYVEGNHDQWITEGTSLLIGYIACKFAGVSDIYAKNIQLVTQPVTKDGKTIPFNFLIVHGEGMPTDIINALKKGLQTATKQNVDAIIFGHTHKMGSSTASVLSKNGNGKWVEKQVTVYNPGTILEASDYADKAGYPANTSFDGTVMHCSVKIGRDGKLKKCIDLQNIMEVMPKNAHFDAYKTKLEKLEKQNFNTKDELINAYKDILKECKSKSFQISEKEGRFFVGINGTSELYSPSVNQAVKQKIRADLEYMVSVVKNIPNVSVVLNGDLIFDYNKGYIEKKDYCSDTVADIQDLCGILAPIADKIKVINAGKMEEGIMNVERDKSNGRISNPKKDSKELANYAAQTLQLNEKLAYAPYNKEEMHSLQLAYQNDQVNAQNQKNLNKAYEDFMKKLVTKNDYAGFEDVMESGSEKSRTKRIKEALIKKLKEEKKILDISNPEDKELIDKLYPLEKIDLRMPNRDLIGNIFCKMLNINPNKIALNPVVNSATRFKVANEEGKAKIVDVYYTPTLPKFMKELSAKLTVSGVVPDVVLLNNYNKTGNAIQEFTTQLRVSYFDKNKVKRVKDVLVIDTGSYSYDKYLTAGMVPSNLVYKITDVEPIFKSLIPADSVNFPGKAKKRPVVEKYNLESVLEENNFMERAVQNVAKQSLKRALKNFDKKNIEIENNEYTKKFEDEFKS